MSLENPPKNIPSTTNFFLEARPVWFRDFTESRHVYAGFRLAFDWEGGSSLWLRVTGATLYRIFCNGVFLHHGPARAAHGFFRVDALNLLKLVKPGRNIISVEVASYQVDSFGYTNQRGFLQAEIITGTQVLAATGVENVEGFILPQKLLEVERYGFQRPFAEAYRMNADTDKWHTSVSNPAEPTPLLVLNRRELICRNVPVPAYAFIDAIRAVGRGSVTYRQLYSVDRSAFWWMVETRWEQLNSPKPEECEIDLLLEYKSLSFEFDASFLESSAQDVFGKMAAGSFCIFDLGINQTGFFRAEITCAAQTRFIIAFGEILTDGDILFERDATLNMIYYELEAGTYSLESLEPYTARYCKVIAVDADVDLSRVCLRTFKNPQAHLGTFSSSDHELELLFEAARETFSQNALDIFMDCPGRERAGWLCDSFFTGRVEPMLCGNSLVETNFIENFCLPERFDHIPEGMLPMCYPAEHRDAVFIPQWAMWLILELEEFKQRSPESDLVERMHSKVDALLGFFKQYENADGLLESLPGWNFIEWSKANELIKDVNYPTNMLYARFLEVVGKMYGDRSLLEKAMGIHQRIREQSFDGQFFVDNGERDEKGALQSSGQSSEVCQYYAFFCGTACPDSHPDLWRILMCHYGPNKSSDASESILHPANAFIGYYMRMELLSRYRCEAKLLAEMKGYFLSMARLTGTLWEHSDVRASCNHGFASHLCVHLYRDILGLRAIDYTRKEIVFCPPQNTALTHCSGSIPVKEGILQLSWEQEGDRLKHGIQLADGWRIVATDSAG